MNGGSWLHYSFLDGDRNKFERIVLRFLWFLFEAGLVFLILLLVTNDPSYSHGLGTISLITNSFSMSEPNLTKEVMLKRILKYQVQLFNVHKIPSIFSYLSNHGINIFGTDHLRINANRLKGCDHQCPCSNMEPKFSMEEAFRQDQREALDPESP